jgi:putative oxidoreductase
MTKAIGLSSQENKSILDTLAEQAHWAPRIALASVFLFHGLTKFPNLSGMAEMMGLPVAILTLVALAEAAGGALIIIGAFTKEIVTRLGGLLLIPPMLGAISMVHWGRWSFTPAEGFPMGGMEFQVTLLLLAVYFVLRGNRN